MSAIDRLDDDDPLPSPDEFRALAEEIRQDEFAARVRDYGEADAATYDARMAEAYRHRAEALGLAGPPEGRPPVTDAELERLVGELERGWAQGHGAMDDPPRPPDDADHRNRGEGAGDDAPRRGPSAGPGRMPGGGLLPDDEPVGFQVWHRRGGHFERVAVVESNALGAIMMTTHGFLGYGRWHDNPGVSAVPGEHRSTDIGDVLIGPDGRSLQIAADDGLRLRPVAPVDQVFEQVAADLRQHWWGDGFGYGLGLRRDSWPQVPAKDRIAYLAGFAAAHDVSFERFTDAARRMLGMEPGQEFPDDLEPHLHRELARQRESYAQYRDDQQQSAEAESLRPREAKEPDSWVDDIAWSDPPPPARERVEEQIRQLKQRTEWSTIVELDIVRDEALSGRSWGELTEVQKLHQLTLATDVMRLDPGETIELMAREVDFGRVPLDEQAGIYGRPFHELGLAVPCGRGPAGQSPPIRVEPGEDNPLSWRDDRSFDIRDATGKIGYVTGYLGGPWSDADLDTEFRVTHVEITAPGRTLSPGEWKDVLRGLRRNLPEVAGLVGGNRGGEGGDLSPAYEKLFRLPPPESADYQQQLDAAAASGRDRQEEKTRGPER